MPEIQEEQRGFKFRAILGISARGRLVRRDIVSPRRICDDPSAATLPRPHRTTRNHRACVFKAWQNLSGPMWFQSQNQTLAWDRAAFRWSAPSPGSRTCRKDHAPSHRPQMSSGRLFLDRVARQQSPSPLHRHSQNNMRFSRARVKGDISILLGRGHFYFALTPVDDDFPTPSRCGTIPRINPWG